MHHTHKLHLFDQLEIAMRTALLRGLKRRYINCLDASSSQ